MITIKELPISERPYEKLQMYGENKLSNSELLAIIIKTGTKKETAIDIAQNILAKSGKENLRSLQEMTLNDLTKIKGIGKVKAIQIKAVCELAKRMSRPIDKKIVIKQPKDVANLLMNEMQYEKREIIKLLILNTKNILHKVIDISYGDLNNAEVPIRQIFEETIKIGMNRFILVHNHPSGDPTPSAKDYETTEKIKQAAKLMNMQFLDHIVIGDGLYKSIILEENKSKNQ